MELLTLLIENRGKVVSREAIIERLWGKDVFLETEHSIHTAINKVRRALRDHPGNPLILRANSPYYFSVPSAGKLELRDRENPSPR